MLSEGVVARWRADGGSDGADRGDASPASGRSGMAWFGNNWPIHPHRADIISDMVWGIELEPEVQKWMDGLSIGEFATVVAHVERLGQRGNQLRMPVSRSLGDGLFELRLDLLRVSWRITYFFAEGRRIVLLTVFRKQRQNERREVQRAHWTMNICLAEKHTAEED